MIRTGVKVRFLDKIRVQRQAAHPVFNPTQRNTYPQITEVRARTSCSGTLHANDVAERAREGRRNSTAWTGSSGTW